MELDCATAAGVSLPPGTEIADSDTLMMMIYASSCSEKLNHDQIGILIGIPDDLPDSLLP
jgi:hypothetical protein